MAAKKTLYGRLSWALEMAKGHNCSRRFGKLHALGDARTEAALRMPVRSRTCHVVYCSLRLRLRPSQCATTSSCVSSSAACWSMNGQILHTRQLVS
jgi:hypothetical protein